MAKRKALLYSYAEDKNYEIEVEENIFDVEDDEEFDWETNLLFPIEDEQGVRVNTECGVSWGWA